MQWELVKKTGHGRGEGKENYIAKNYTLGEDQGNFTQGGEKSEGLEKRL